MGKVGATSLKTVLHTASDRNIDLTFISTQGLVTAIFEIMENKMIRIVLLRALMAWYMIPFAYLIVLPIIWLLTDDIAYALKEVRVFSSFLWNGE